jgi:hypothetical protein
MRKKDYPKSKADGVKRATKEAILKIVAENNVSLTAKILTANDTGLGISDLRNLNCNIILDNPNKNFIHIHTKRQKTGDKVDTFLGFDAITALKNYLSARGYSLFRALEVRLIQYWIPSISLKSSGILTSSTTFTKSALSTSSFGANLPVMTTVVSSGTLSSSSSTSLTSSSFQ